MEKVKYLMIHHSAVSYDKNKDQFKANNNYHNGLWNFKSSLGFYLGYNYEIAKNGRVRQARKDGEQTAACYQENMNNGRCIHICLDGNFDNEKPQPAQIFALRDLMRRLVKEHSIDKIVFHNEYANKSCPGSNMEKGFIESLVDFKPKAPATPDKEVIKNKIIELLSKL